MGLRSSSQTQAIFGPLLFKIWRSEADTTPPGIWNGLIDEVRVSSTARSADWVATEYSNQSSPGTFYSLSPESQVIAPSAVTLYGGQSQQFTSTVLVSCNASVSWSMSPQSLGSLTPNGSYSALYAAPASIATQQTVTITATNTVTLYCVGCRDAHAASL